MSVIDEIKQRLDIVQIVSAYIALQKSGKNYRALCPFHSEKNPSFFVFPDRQSWHCFGSCNTGGDVFSFIMKKEGVDFSQALKLLADKAGINLTAPSGYGRQDLREVEKILKINEAAANYYHNLLLNNSEGETARRYLTQRGLSIESIKNFQLGFAPEGWEALKNHLIEVGYDEADLLVAGLLIEQENKRTYDRFRNRLIFPIRDAGGKLVGFGARALDDSPPKYLNSPQTAAFDKSSILYGIDRAKNAIRHSDQAIIVEGYMDVITAHQYGWQNVVASMGTSITEKQLLTLKNLTRNLVFALDADAAGTEAIFRGGELVDKVIPFLPSIYGWVKYEDAYRAEVKAILLPQNKDPDEVIKEDPELWHQLIKSARPIIDFVIDAIVTKVNLESAAEKSIAVEKLMPLLLEIKDPVRQAHYVERLAHHLKIDPRALDDAIRKTKALRKAPAKVAATGQMTAVLPLSSPVEQYCLALLLQYPELKTEATELSLECFEQSENRELFLRWQQSAELADLQKNLDAPLQEYMEGLLSKEIPTIVRQSEALRRSVLQDCIIRLHEKRLRNLEIKKQELLAAEAETGGITAQLTRLEEQGVEISKQLKEIFKRQSNLRQQLTGRSSV